MCFFLLLNTKEDILKNVGNQTVDHGPHLLVYIFHTVGTNNCLISEILQNIFFCVQQKNEIHKFGTTWGESK